MLLVILMISYPIMASDEIPLENLKKVEGGFYISDENIIQLANYIQDLKEESNRLQNLTDVLNNSLLEEREQASNLLTEKDNIIELQKQQIADYKELYRNKDPDIFEKASWAAAGGAGVAAVLLLLVTIGK